MSFKLKLLRLQAGLTLEALAHRAALTRSYVSKLERGVATPSIAAALRLAKSLDVSVEALFGESSSDEPVTIHRAPRGRQTDPPGPRIVSGALPGRRMAAFVVTPDDGPVRHAALNHHAGEEILYVLKGSISLTLARRSETLQAGDSAHFNASIPHRLKSIGRHTASVLIVVVEDDATP